MQQFLLKGSMHGGWRGPEIPTLSGPHSNTSSFCQIQVIVRHFSHHVNDTNESNEYYIKYYIILPACCDVQVCSSMPVADQCPHNKLQKCSLRAHRTVLGLAPCTASPFLPRVAVNMDVGMPRARSMMPEQQSTLGYNFRWTKYWSFKATCGVTTPLLSDLRHKDFWNAYCFVEILEISRIKAVLQIQLGLSFSVQAWFH